MRKPVKLIIMSPSRLHAPWRVGPSYAYRNDRPILHDERWKVHYINGIAHYLPCGRHWLLSRRFS